MFKLETETKIPNCKFCNKPAEYIFEKIISYFGVTSETVYTCNSHNCKLQARLQLKFK